MVAIVDSAAKDQAKAEEDKILDHVAENASPEVAKIIRRASMNFAGAPTAAGRPLRARARRRRRAGERAATHHTPLPCAAGGASASSQVARKEAD